MGRVRGDRDWAHGRSSSNPLHHPRWPVLPHPTPSAAPRPRHCSPAGLAAPPLGGGWAVPSAGGWLVNRSAGEEDALFTVHFTLGAEHVGCAHLELAVAANAGVDAVVLNGVNATEVSSAWRMGTGGHGTVLGVDCTPARSELRRPRRGRSQHLRDLRATDPFATAPRRTAPASTAGSPLLPRSTTWRSARGQS